MRCRHFSGRCKVLLGIVTVIVLIVAGLLIWYFRKQDPSVIYVYSIGSVDFSTSDASLRIYDNNRNILQGSIGKHANRFSITPDNCVDMKQPCFKFSDGSKVSISSLATNGDVTCSVISWEADDCHTDSLMDCFNLAGAHWYGGAQVNLQYWPNEYWSFDLQPYVTRDSYYTDQFGGVLERYWISSNGIGIHLDQTVPLFVSFNQSGDQQLCLAARYRNSPYLNPQNLKPHLNYTICPGASVKDIHQFMTERYFQKPKDIPDEKLFRYPIWSTWAYYKQGINQTSVLEYANQIRMNNFSNSQLEIDDDWTLRYGDQDFVSTKFPDPKGMVQTLTAMGFRVTLWTHPFANYDSKAFVYGMENGYFVKDSKGELPGLVRWWNGVGAILDVTNTNATNWYLTALRNLTDMYGISSFKFDAGETKWLPPSYKPHLEFSNPNTYTRLWSELAYEADKNVRHQEVRVGSQTQHLPIFVRMLDKDSTWGYDNGLKTLIPAALTFGLLGYPFVLPDMIGGNAYNGSLNGLAYPERELFIRWLQVNVFLPSIQFSIAPWHYDDEVVKISLKMVNLREKYAEKIISIAKEATRTGAPVVRPLWWIAPDDETAQTIDSEFLLGDDILVAPVLDSGARSRDIYLPAGTWKDEQRANKEYVVENGMWLQKYRALLDELPYFSRIKRN